jgi:hypothetical protein
MAIKSDVALQIASIVVGGNRTTGISYINMWSKHMTTYYTYCFVNFILCIYEQCVFDAKSFFEKAMYNKTNEGKKK